MAMDISRRTARRATYSRGSDGRLTPSAMETSAPHGDRTAAHRLQSLANEDILLDTPSDDLMRFGATAVIVIDK